MANVYAYPLRETRYSAVLHRLAQLITVATMLLIFMGGLVTSHGAGLSVPDWPNSYGYNMFTFPPGKWVGGIFYEHTHRLMGTVVGLLSLLIFHRAWAFGQSHSGRRWIIGIVASLVALSVFNYSFDYRLAKPMSSLLGGIALAIAPAYFMRNRCPELSTRWLMTAILCTVIFQGILGGLRVIWVKLDLAIVHACVAQAFLCLACFAAIVTSKFWLESSNDFSDFIPAIARLALVTTIIIYLQLIIGATMRHEQAGLAIPDFPLNYGRLIPPTDQLSLDNANDQRIAYQLPPVTLGQIWLHFAHRIGAVIVTIFCLACGFAVFRSQSAALRRAGGWLVVLVIIQVTLGVLTVIWKKPADIASTHVAVGALTLMTAFTLTIRAYRLSPRPILAPESVLFAKPIDAAVPA